MSKFCKKYFVSFVAVALAFVMAICYASGGFLTFAQKSTQGNVRRVELSQKYATELSVFDSYTIEEENDQPSFSGIMKYSDEYSTYFDCVSTDDVEDCDIRYDCTFDMEKLQYHFTASLIDENGNVVESESMVTDAFVTKNGGLDAYVKIEGEQYLLSELYETENIDSCGLFSKLLAAVVTASPFASIVAVVYVIVGESAEQIKARSNKDYNESLESDGNGVNSEYYVKNQAEIAELGYRAGNYKFGFASFADVGCEVAAAYNAMIALGKAERLSQTIYSFETLAIEFSIAWGNFGSDPMAMDRYFDSRNIKYVSYSNLSDFETTLRGKDKCCSIMSKWNNSIFDGLHTFYVEKTGKSGNDAYKAYNKRNKIVSSDSVSAYNDGAGFIIGYILWVE